MAGKKLFNPVTKFEGALGFLLALLTGDLLKIRDLNRLPMEEDPPVLGPVDPNLGLGELTLLAAAIKAEVEGALEAAVSA